MFFSKKCFSFFFIFILFNLSNEETFEMEFQSEPKKFFKSYVVLVWFTVFLKGQQLLRLNCNSGYG